MRILIIGAYGLIGSACLARLHRDGHELTGLGRSVVEARRQYPFARWIAADIGALGAAGWAPILAGIDAVVNCAGALQDGAGDDTRRVHVTATAALVEGCIRAGVRRLIHISAIGADAAGASDFARTKAEAERIVAASALDYAILRPALVLAPGAYGGSAMLRALAAFPVITPVVAPASRVQVIGSADLADAVAAALEPGAPARVTWDVAHPQIHTLAEIVIAIRRWLGFPQRPMLRVPAGLAAIVGGAADALAWLGWRSPARSTALAQLAAGVVGDPSAWIAATGATPRGLDEILAQMPAGVQERWFARLYLLKPVAIAGLALFWIATGIVALWPGRAAAAAHMLRVGFGPALAETTVIAGALFDIVLGLMLCVSATARSALRIMLVVTPLYLLAGTLLDPQLWLDPLGALLKVVPLLVATALSLAIMDAR